MCVVCADQNRTADKQRRASLKRRMFDKDYAYTGHELDIIGEAHDAVAEVKDFLKLNSALGTGLLTYSDYFFSAVLSMLAELSPLVKNTNADDVEANGSATSSLSRMLRSSVASTNASGQPMRYSSVPTVRVTTSVRASVQDVVAFLMDFESHYFTAKFQNDSNQRERRLLDSTDRSLTTYHRVRIFEGKRFRDRTAVTKWVVGEPDDNGEIMLAGLRTAHADAPEDDRYVRALRANVVIKLRPTVLGGGGLWSAPGEGQAGLASIKQLRSRAARSDSIMEVYTQYFFSLPHDHSRYLFRKLYHPITMAPASETQRYFQRLRKLDELDATDGTALGHMLVDASSSKKTGNRMSRGTVRHTPSEESRVKDVSAYFKKSLAMSQALALYPWLKPLLVRALENKPRPSKKCKTPLADLTHADGMLIGKGMAAIMLGNLNPEAAVNEFMAFYPALIDLSERELWFQPYMNALAKRLMSLVSIGVKARLFVGAFLSISDVITDCLMIRKYWILGEYTFFIASVTMVVLSMLLQCGVAYVQNHKKPSVMWREFGYVLIQLKPVMDVHNYSQLGGEMQDYQAMLPYDELTMTKMCEM